MKEVSGFKVTAYNTDFGEVVENNTFIVLTNGKDYLSDEIYEEVEKRFFTDDFYNGCMSKVKFSMEKIKKEEPQFGCTTMFYRSIDCKHTVQIVISPVNVLDFTNIK